MKTYEQFIDSNVKYKLYIEESDEFDDTPWKLTIDVKTIWSDYESEKISLVDFNNQYATKLIENSENIAKACGDMAWNEIEPVAVNELRNATDLEKSENIYDELYDIFDKYEINLII